MKILDPQQLRAEAKRLKIRLTYNTEFKKRIPKSLNTLAKNIENAEKRKAQRKASPKHKASPKRKASPKHKASPKRTSVNSAVRHLRRGINQFIETKMDNKNGMAKYMEKDMQKGLWNLMNKIRENRPNLHEKYKQLLLTLNERVQANMETNKERRERRIIALNKKIEKITRLAKLNTEQQLTGDIEALNKRLGALHIKNNNKKQNIRRINRMLDQYYLEKKYFSWRNFNIQLSKSTNFDVVEKLKKEGFEFENGDFVVAPPPPAWKRFGEMSVNGSVFLSPDKKQIIKIANNPDATGQLKMIREAKIQEMVYECTKQCKGHTNGTPLTAKVFGCGPNWMLMEKLEGKTLGQIVEKKKWQEWKFPYLWRYIIALQQIHKCCSVLHMDAHGANVIFTKSGIKVIDWGMAQLIPVGQKISFQRIMNEYVHGLRWLQFEDRDEINNALVRAMSGPTSQLSTELWGYEKNYMRKLQNEQSTIKNLMNFVHNYNPMKLKDFETWTFPVTLNKP